jgi:PAS domain S-box-containing protein
MPADAMPLPSPAPTLADLRHALDQAAIVATTDVQGTITYVNDRFCEISQYSAGELLGSNHRILNSGLHPGEYFREMYRTIGNGGVWRGEIRNRARDGSLYWVDTTVVPFLDSDGRPYQYIAIRYDITERKRSEALVREQNALAQLGKMAAVVAHEVGNPLAAMRGALQIVDGRLAGRDAEQAVLKDVMARIDSLNDLVQELLLFARPRRSTPVSLSVRDLLCEKASLLSHDPRFSGVTFDVDADEVRLSADLGQIRQVLLNILINSAQAMNGRGRIALCARSLGRSCEISIADTGPGMAPDVRNRLFEPFFTTKHRGTGIGLATARQIVEAHGGTIAVACPPRGGTVTTILLPLAMAD